jgi:hypothetical protein
MRGFLCGRNIRTIPIYGPVRIGGISASLGPIQWFPKLVWLENSNRLNGQPVCDWNVGLRESEGDASNSEIVGYFSMMTGLALPLAITHVPINKAASSAASSRSLIRGGIRLELWSDCPR